MSVSTSARPGAPAVATEQATTATTATTPTGRDIRRRLPLRWLSPVAVLAGWQLGSASGLVPERILPAPSTVLAAGWSTVRSGELADALLVSTQRVLIGFVVGAVLGLGLGAVVGLSRLGELAVDPPLQMLRTVPHLGLVPLFILWFGIGETPKVAMVALGVAFPLYLNTCAGIRGVDGKLLELARVLRLGRWRRLRTIVFPGALPHVLVGLRQSLGIAWLSLIVAEQINSDAGLGYLINNARDFLRTDLVVLGLVAYALLGLLTDGIVRLVERRALRWRTS
jgi:sulfonate transport system permease protein